MPRDELVIRLEARTVGLWRLRAAALSLWLLRPFPAPLRRVVLLTPLLGALNALVAPAAIDTRVAGERHWKRQRLGVRLEQREA